MNTSQVQVVGLWRGICRILVSPAPTYAEDLVSVAKVVEMYPQRVIVLFPEVGSDSRKVTLRQRLPMAAVF